MLGGILVQFINTQYKILRLDNEDKYGSTFIVEDIYNANLVKRMRIINLKKDTKHFISYMKNSVYDYRCINHPNIAKFYSFNRVNFVDKKPATDNRYYYTFENFESQNIFNYCKSLDFESKLDLAFQLCSAIYYMHLRNYILCDINKDEIRVVQRDGKPVLTIASLFYPQDVENSILIDSHINYFKAPEVFETNRFTELSDIYLIGVMLYHIFTEQGFNIEDFKSSFDRFKPSDGSDLMKVKKIIKKSTELDTTLRYKSVHNIIEDMNKAFDKEYISIDKKVVNVIPYYTRPVAREYNIETTLENVRKYMDHNQQEIATLVVGESGAGKSYFLKYIAQRIEMEGFITHTKIATKDDKKYSLICSLIKDVYNYADMELKEKYMADISKIAPEITGRISQEIDIEADKEEGKARLIYRLGSFLLEAGDLCGSVVIIKEMEYIDQASLAVIQYIINNQNKGKVYFVFSFKSDDNSASEFIQGLININFINTIKLTNFSLNETIEYISTLLGTKEKPIEFGTNIFKETDGNPYLIYELVHMAHNNGYIRINEHYKWEYDNIDFKKFKSNISVDDITLKKISNLTQPEIQILEASSIFDTAVSFDIIDEMLESKMNSNLYSILSSLSDRNILSRKVDDWGANFDFSSPNIKKAVYDNIKPHIKIKYHQRAANILENKFLKENRENKDELIYHMIRADRCDEAIDYLVESANRILESNLIPQAIHFLEQSLKLFDEGAVGTKKALICKRLGDLNKQLCKYDLALKYYSIGELSAAKGIDARLVVDININMFDTFYKINDIRSCLLYASKSKRLLKSINYPEGEYELVIALYDLMIYRRKYKAYEKILKSYLSKCVADKYKYYHAMLLITHGRTIQILGEYRKGLETILKGSKTLEEVGALSKLPLALNAIGKIYIENYHDLQKAKEYFERCLKISEKLNLTRFIEASYNNIAEVYREEDRYVETLEYYNKALEVTKMSGNKRVQTMIELNCAFIYLEKGDLKKARTYASIACEYLFKSKDVGNLLEYYYEFEASFNYNMGNLEDAIEYAQKSIDICTSWGIPTNMNTIFTKTISEFGLKKIDYEEIYNLCKQLYDQHLYKLARFACVRFAEICIYRGNTIEGQELYNLGMSYKDEIDTTLLQSKYKYVDAILSLGEDKLDKLNDLLSKYSNIEDKNIKCKVYCTIGKYYFEQKRYVEALKYFIHALDYLKKQIYNVPDENKGEYISSNDRGEIKVQLLKTIGFIKGNPEYTEEVEFKDADTYFEIERYKDILRNTENLSKFQLQHFDKEEINAYLYKLFETINKLADNSLKNLSYILDLCVELTDAKNAFIVMFDEESEFKVLSSLNNNSQLTSFSRYIIEQVRQSNKSVFITDAYEYERKRENFRIDDNVSSVICIPISSYNKNDKGRRREEEKNSSVGYLYLDTDSIINNFTPQSLTICTIAAKLACIIVDNYNLKAISTIDKLTRLYTRKYFEKMLQNEMYKAKKENRRFSILMIDIDRFKSVNDRFGHQKGDEILQSVANIVMENVRDTDVCARYGGEEFILLLPNTDSQGAKSLAEKLRKGVEKSRLLGLSNPLTVSIGISCFPENSTWEKDLIDKSDKALYFAKENNRNRSVIYKPNMSSIVKKIDKLLGIISGNMVEDQSNVETILEILELVKNHDIPLEKKLFQFLGRIIEISEADIGGIFAIKDGVIEKVICRRSRNEMAFDNMNYNKELLENCIKRKSGEFIIDWINYLEVDTLTNIPDWQSVITVPIVIRESVKAVLYLSVSIKKKEFEASKYNYIRTIFDILSVIY